MHCPNSTTTQHRRRSTERADIAQLLEPSYQPSTSSTPTTIYHQRVYTDASGTVHDPEFRFFPTDEWKMLESMRRRSFDDDDREEVIDDDEDDVEYAFGGSKSRNYYNYNNNSFNSQKRSTTTTATSTMSSLRYSHSSPRLNTYSSSSTQHYPPTPSSPAFSYTLTLPDALEPSSPTSSFADDSCSTPTKKKLPRLFGCPKRYSHEIYDEDAGWQGDEEEDVEVPPPTPELIRDSPLEEEDELSSQQQQSKHHLSTDLRKKWQVLQLTVQFAIFRSSKRWKKSRVSF